MKREREIAWSELVGQTLRPPLWYWFMYLGLFAVELVFAIGTFLQEESHLWLKVFYFAFTMMFVGGIIELLRGAVTVDNLTITVRGLLTTDVYPLDKIIQTKVEDGRLYLHLSAGNWVKMPMWFGNSLKKLYDSGRIKANEV